MLQLTGHKDQTQFPRNETVAFTRGLFNQRWDSSVRVIQEDGREKVIYGGYKAHDIDLVPSIAVGETISGTSRNLHNSWYELNVGSEQTIDASIDGIANEDYTLRIMKGDLSLQVAHGRGGLTWNAEPGTWYVAVCPNPEAPDNYQLSIASQN